MDEKRNVIIKVIISGSRNVGKSWMVSSFLKQDFPTTATIGAKFEQCLFEDHDHVTYKFQLFEISITRFNRFQTFGFFSHNTGSLLVFDLTDTISFDIAIEQLKYARPGIPVTLVGNKCDCVAKREISYDRIQTVCDEMELQYIEVSAKDNINIKLLFHKLLERVKENGIKDNVVR